MLIKSPTTEQSMTDSNPARDILGLTYADHLLLERLLQDPRVLKTPIAMALCASAGHPAAGNPDACREVFRTVTRAAGTYVPRANGEV